MSIVPPDGGVTDCGGAQPPTLPHGAGRHGLAMNASEGRVVRVTNTPSSNGEARHRPVIWDPCAVRVRDDTALVTTSRVTWRPPARARERQGSGVASGPPYLISVPRVESVVTAAAMRSRGRARKRHRPPPACPALGARCQGGGATAPGPGRSGGPRGTPRSPRRTSPDRTARGRGPCGHPSQPA